MAQNSRFSTEQFSSRGQSFNEDGSSNSNSQAHNTAINILFLLGGFFFYYFFFGTKRITEDWLPTRTLDLYKEALVEQALYKQALIGESVIKTPYLDFYKVKIAKLKQQLEIKVKNQKQIRQSCNQNIPKYQQEVVYDAELSQLIINFYKDKKATSIADIGGNSQYLQDFTKANLNAILFVADRGEESKNIQQTPTLKKMNFIDSLNPTKQFDIVLSINVVQHLFLEYEGVFLDNLASHSSKWLIVSWSRYATDGIKHFNNRDNPYAIQRFVDRGFIFSEEDTHSLRKELRNSFANTLLVFKRR